jgi:hypothetical protein
LANAAEQTVIIKEFKDGFFPYIGGEIKQFFEVLKQDVNPDLHTTGFEFRKLPESDARIISRLIFEYGLEV